MSCGGGSGGGSNPNPNPNPTPTPPVGDFQLVVNSPTITVQQGGQPLFEVVQANPSNGFKGTINLAITGLPSGVSTTSAAPSITVTASPQAVALQLAAALSAPVATSTVTITGTSGAISHSVTFAVAVRQAAPFSIQLSQSSISLTPASATTVQVSVTGDPATQLAVDVSGAPNGSQIRVGSPQGFVTPANPGTFPVEATVLAQPLQNFPISVIASDNANNTAFVTFTLTVTVPFTSTPALTRSTFVRTDTSPTGMVYDPLRKQLFVSNEILNQVLVLSAADGHQVASIPVNFPAGIDVAADESAIYVVSPFVGGVTIIDPNRLQVIGHSDVPFSASGLTQPVTFFQVAALSNGKVLFLPTSQSEAGFQPFYLWDPVTDTYTKFGSSALTNFTGLITRSADHSKVLSSGGVEGILYDATTDTFSGPDVAFGGAGAISPDGSQIVSASFAVSPPLLTFYDQNLNQLAALPLDPLEVTGGGSTKLFYSLDGKRLYMVPDQGIGPSGVNPVAVVIDTTTFSVLGVVPAFQFGAILPFSGQWITTFAVDETGMLFGAAFDGVGLLDLTSPIFLREPTPGVLFFMQPSLASISSPSQAQLSGAFLSATDSYSVFFGAPPASPQTLQASNVAFQSQNFLNLTIPPASNPGPANATLTRSDGFFQIMPDAITYGPTILSIDANAGPASGGSTITISGYGLSRPNTQVTIGGRPAAVTQQVPGFVDLGHLLPIEQIKATTPAGTSGKADVTVSTAAGSTTVAGGFHYLSSFAVDPTVGLLDAIVYDKLRQRLYMSNQDHNRVEVFDLATNSYLSPLPAGTSPTALTLTPDGALLAVLNRGDSTVSVIDLTANTLKANFSLLTAADSNPVGCGGVAVNLTNAQPHRAMVDVVCTSAAFNGVFHLINLDTGSLDCTGVAGCSANGTDINFQNGLAGLASSSDGTKILLATSAGGGTPLPVGLLDLNANTLTAGAAIDVRDAAMSTDGTVFAANFALLDAAVNLRGFTAAEPYADAGALSFHNVFGEKLNASGSLLFYPQDSGVTIFDVHTGRLARHIVLPVSIPLDSGGLALDETGTKIFLITTTGIAIAQLDSAPLSIGNINPVAGPSGTTIVIRGSGFQNGATITFGATQVIATFVDSSTLNATAPTLPPGVVQITVKNPDGSKYSLDGAYTVQ
ncbi:MAG TPA: IPT/TIG domain-containing protein [Candidatus Angelobacter sp.]